MISTLRQFRSFGRPAQILFINEIGVTIALLMLAPYLADHLVHGIGVAVWLVGIVMSLRHFSEGLFVIGGTLADRIGYKPMIIAGCLLKSGGCAMFAAFTSLPWLIAASVITGISSALFIPANRAYLAHEESERIVDAFAVFSVCRRLGVLLGPLLGIPLVHFGFRMVSLTSVAILLALAVAQWRLLPAITGPETGSSRPIWADWREALSNRPFLAFAATMFASYALHFQITFGLPLEIRRISGGHAGMTALFVISAVLGLALQVRLITWCEKFWTPGQAMVRGLIVMSLAFIPLMLPPLHGSTVIRLLPILVCAAALSIGSMMLHPFEMATIANLSEGRVIGTYYSVNNLLSGFGGVFGNLVSAAAISLSHSTGIASLPWLVLLLLGLSSAACLRLVDRGGRLTPGRLRPPQEAVAAP
ncbi:MFS transporter [Actinomadura sp. DC4]|uniref:MFS transporter n=1 Tax=Actinomadura sp. DC4 TaxID=3055069 RepID=UPI0025B20DF3|nr:MFS transporter [Actinomadura sp. DC4]MDN3357945.1 MFS transporter [Actinomadura sp. DC4]